MHGIYYLILCQQIRPAISYVASRKYLGGETGLLFCLSLWLMRLHTRRRYFLMNYFICFNSLTIVINFKNV